MDNYHDPIRHLKYLRQSLAQDNEAIGFFISAGCPLSVEMPEGEWPLIPDVQNLTLHINAQLSLDKKYNLLIAEIEKAGKNIKNIEDILSFLRSLLVVSKGGDVRGLTEADLTDIQSKICTEIINKINVSLPNNETPYHSLCKWIRSIDRKVAVEIFTTNYDLLLEHALEDLEVPYFDGFVGANRSFFDLRAVEDNLIPVHWSRLWKIHGSINWCQEEINGERRVYRSSEIKQNVSHLIYPSHLKYEESRKMPYLALIDQLNRFIRKKSSFLILSGYSFNDAHLNDTIVNALKANPTAMVLGLMYGEYEVELKTEVEAEVDSEVEAEVDIDVGEVSTTLTERYPEAYKLAKKQHNLNIWTFDKAIIGTNLGQWRRVHAKEEDDIELVRFFGSENQLKLGDFSVFTDFLKKIIGIKRESSNV
ncbi:SIR2 family protein [Cellvibrio fibrivorans]|uniref:SIR2-like domain-containing protein n=1 Tax=Cellvibrio fibrivorans TaxID=126350 RepID=A0ABU1UXP7_9GAMM|nr:SIR2 family protein [Cellvibrio fibrivorans]MDR7089958.1 hypothetical protein [Cellvibrio fibrivorans]